jgi:hypothetical protein
LIVLGGGLAILLGIVLGVIEVTFNMDTPKWVGGAIIHLIVCIIIGFLLIFSYIMCKRDILMGSILAFVFSIVLLAAGGIAGLIGGLLGLLGALIAFLKYLERREPAIQVTKHTKPTDKTPEPKPSESPAPTTRSADDAKPSSTDTQKK